MGGQRLVLYIYIQTPRGDTGRHADTPLPPTTTLQNSVWACAMYEEARPRYREVVPQRQGGGVRGGLLGGTSREDSEERGPDQGEGPHWLRSTPSAHSALGSGSEGATLPGRA